MASTQKIARVRRRYNQWVANQTLEDFALRFTAKSARRWSSLRVGNTALGAISFLALEAIGGAITLSYGFHNAAIAIVVVSMLLFLSGLPISYYAARYGLDIDLLSRGAGFGYIGSTITSLIYASFTFIFFAIEAAIMSAALDLVFGIPLSIGYLISSIIVIPLVTHGITFISRLQLWTQPLWVVLHVLPFIVIAFTSFESFEEWTRFTGDAGDKGTSFNLLLFGAAGSVIFSLIAQIGEQVDFLRFMPEKTEENRFEWWASLISAGPGWIIVGGFKLLAGSFLAYLAVSQFLPREDAIEPTQMYFMAFQMTVNSTDLALLLTGVFVILSQIKINVTNSYAGSIAWSNFFSRLTHSHPGRVVWLVFNVGIAFLLMEMGIYKALEQILGLYSIVAVAWVGALVADLVVNKPLGLSPKGIEFKRAHLFDFNPVGVGAMTLAALVAVISFAGLIGETAQALSSFTALAVSFTASPLIAWWTKGNYYIARTPAPFSGQTTAQCCICEHSFETEDMAHCPVYAGHICSLCCSLDARCGDSCKQNAQFTHQMYRLFRAVLPRRVLSQINARIAQYIGIHFFASIVLGVILFVLYVQSSLDSSLSEEALASLLWRAFVILTIVSGVISWLFVLASESQSVAMEETSRQTKKLEDEIEAHQKTDAALQVAKEAADAANLAKSRFVNGLAHELRTPLNAIFGYAQILERDKSIPDHRTDAVGVIRRSSSHLASLIEGIADISKIESGQLHLLKNRVNLEDFFHQLEDVFGLQARNKGLEFTVDLPRNLPSDIYIDEKRLQQVLINLLTNAIKFTPTGSVNLRVRYRNPIAEFKIIDTGVGIPLEDQTRIFEPFERANTPPVPNAKGSGLGLAITKMLVTVMGGEIFVSSAPGQGSTFTIKMFLSEILDGQSEPKTEAPITGYEGRKRTILVVDDDPAHRGMLVDLLTPFGFDVYSASDGQDALRSVQTIEPDLFLLDVSMPDMSGWQLSRLLRKSKFQDTPILMVSANNRHERLLQLGMGDDEYLMKPVALPDLLKRLKEKLNLKWAYESAPSQNTNLKIDPVDVTEDSFAVPDAAEIDELLAMGEIGHIKAIKDTLAKISNDNPDLLEFSELLLKDVKQFEIDRYMHTLKKLRVNHD